MEDRFFLIGTILSKSKLNQDSKGRPLLITKIMLGDLHSALHDEAPMQRGDFYTIFFNNVLAIEAEKKLKVAQGIRLWASLVYQPSPHHQVISQHVHTKEQALSSSKSHPLLSERKRSSSGARVAGAWQRYLSSDLPSKSQSIVLLRADRLV